MERVNQMVPKHKCYKPQEGLGLGLRTGAREEGWNWGDTEEF
jgi:hypothetical protein